MDRIKDVLRSGIVSGIFFHAAVMLLSLSLGYNTYKEFVRGYEPLSPEIKASIKGTFPWVIFSFTALYLLLKAGGKSKKVLLGPFSYAAAVAAHVFFTNFFARPLGKDVVIPVNLSTVYFVFFISIILGIKRFRKLELRPPDPRDWLPPALYRFGERNLPVVYGVFRGRPSLFFIGGYSALIGLGALLFLVKEEGVAEVLSNVAYYLLLIGLGIETRDLIRYGGNGRG